MKLIQINNHESSVKELVEFQQFNYVTDVKWGCGSQNRRIGVASTNGLCKIYDIDRPKEFSNLSGHTRTVNTIAFNEHQSWMMLTGGQDRSIRLYVCIF